MSLVITTRNRAPLVGTAIESALAIDRDGFGTEVIVVDDGSTDETPDVLRRYPVRVVRTTGLGIAGARNAGLEAATGDFVALLDDDDVWLPNAIGAQLRVFAEHPEFGAVHGRAQRTHADLEPFLEPFPDRGLPSGWIFEDLLGYFPQIGTVVTRMSAAREAGPFATDLHAVDEWDWFLRVAHRHPVGRVEEAVMLFRQRDGAEEELMRARFPDVPRVFHRHVDAMSWRDRIRLEPVMWRHRGWCASSYLDSMQVHLHEGDRRRALRCLRYALVTSPPHTGVELARRTLRRAA